MTDITPQQVLLPHLLPLVPFEGWTPSALRQAAKAAGYSTQEVQRLFPRGAMDAIDTWSRMADHYMTERYAQHMTETMNIRARIALLVRLRLEYYLPHREALRRALALYAVPWNRHKGIAAMARTSDMIWRTLGDASTDYNWYTKRILLSGVYASTMLFWLEDESPQHTATDAFLERRIADVMQIEKLKFALRKAAGMKK